MPRQNSTTCRNNHPWTGDNIDANGVRRRRCIYCRREHAAIRKQQLIDEGLLQPTSPHIRYEYDIWIEGTTFYIKVIPIEYERATEDSFALAARRKTRKELARLGYDENLARGIGALAVWDQSKNWADLMTETVTYQLTRPLPIAVDEAA